MYKLELAVEDDVVVLRLVEPVVRTNIIYINGYNCSTLPDGQILTEETFESKAWKAMVQFAARYPLGTEPQWDAFIDKHTAMQISEEKKAYAQYAKLRNKN